MCIFCLNGKKNTPFPIMNNWERKGLEELTLCQRKRKYWTKYLVASRTFSIFATYFSNILFDNNTLKL